MRIHTKVILSLVCLLALMEWAQGQTAASTPLAATANQRANLVEGYGKLPLAFEANQGQSDSPVKFLSRGAGYTLFLTADEAVLTLQSSAIRDQHLAGGVLRMKLRGANPKTVVTEQDELPGRSNYFIGNDPKKWHTDVRQYARVHYMNIYPGVDLVYYGHQRELEYDFVLQPGTDPKAIRLGIEGASKLRLDRGDLVVTSAAGEVRLRSPNVYQQANGIRHAVRGRYIITSRNEVGFCVTGYDRKRTLVIDPVLAYATYLGGSNNDYGFGIAVDSTGNAYVTGDTASVDFPTKNPIQFMGSAACDAFVTKFNTEGSALVYSTYLGGSACSNGRGIAVDTAGNAYIGGNTNASDFPTVNPIQPKLAGSTDAFVTKVDPAGSALVYSTYLGGTSNDGTYAVALGPANDVYITGFSQSNDFPTVNAVQPTSGGWVDAFVARTNPAGSALVFSTYLGGSSFESGYGIAVDGVGNAYVTGETWSPNFPTFNALQPNYGGGGKDAFVTKLAPNGDAFAYSTYLGGNYDDVGNGIAVDSAGNAYVTGTTNSLNFPILNAIQPTPGGYGYSDAFVTKINPAGSALVYSTYLGGNYGEHGNAIAVDSLSNAYVTGDTGSTNFPTLNPIQPSIHGGFDAFVTEFNADGSALIYSTYLGGGGADNAYGIAVDSAGNSYVAGTTKSPGKFPITVLAFQPKKGATRDAFVAKIVPQTFMKFSTLKLGFGLHVVGTTSAPKNVTLTNTGTGVLTINQLFIVGANAGDFAQTNNCGSSVAPGATCTISVTFTPTGIGARKAALAIRDSDPASPQGIALSGKGE